MCRYVIAIWWHTFNKPHSPLVLSKYFPDLKKILITTCHDGASKASQVLKVVSVQHCVPHALHLITSDSLNRVFQLRTLVQNCRHAVTTLHFKASMLEDEDTSQKDIQNLHELREKKKETQDTLYADDQFAIPQHDENPDRSEPTVLSDGKPTRAHELLKESCPTRWNSVLAMLKSVSHMSKAVDNCLKRIGRVDLCVNSSELELLTSLTAFLKGFETLTEAVSSTAPVLSMIPLMKVRIKRLCQTEDNDDEALQELKRVVMLNVDRRLC